MELPFCLVAFLALGVDLQLPLDRALVAAVSLVEHVTRIGSEISVSLEVFNVEYVSSFESIMHGQTYPKIVSPFDLLLHSSDQSSNWSPLPYSPKPETSS